MVATLRLKTETLTRYRRLAQLKTDAALAARMGIDPGNLSRVLKGRQTPGPRFIAQLCRAFDAEINELFEVVDAEDDAA
ncbi:helix-turn-helix domain-containing protein [Ornithinimicrobium sufpigmenti]|uniref:helix-turn-helix domain-containing protein n=1 Tax=Ornithinimicrobium sufpigmenti TaxID=2508882 RepID=UPI0010360FC3|nr:MULTISPECIES: helix-turn-helix transcriptional regulator [unclassified Ornithinimicrobium]